MREKLKKIKVLIFAAMMTIAGSVMAFAQEGGSVDVQSAITTAATTAQGQAIGIINSLIPIVMVVISAVVVTTLGIRLFKRFMKG